MPRAQRNKFSFTAFVMAQDDDASFKRDRGGRLSDPVFEAGYVACQQQEGKSSNPYPVGSHSAKTWSDGWEQAHADGTVLEAESGYRRARGQGRSE